MRSSTGCSVDRSPSRADGVCHAARVQRLSITVLVAVLATVLFGVGRADASWSIVGVDSETGEVGVAVASCVGFEVTVVVAVAAVVLEWRRRRGGGAPTTSRP